MTTAQSTSLSLLLVVVGRQVQERLEAELTRIGLAQRHLSALGHIAADEAMSYSELARRSHVTVQSVQATVEHLEALHAVTRGEQGGQGRRAALQVTTSGQRLLERARGCVDTVERELAASLSGADFDAVKTALLGLLAVSPDTPGVQRRGRGREPK